MNQPFSRLAHLSLAMRRSVLLFRRVSTRTTMSSNCSSAAHRDKRPSRRRFLATLGAVASVSTAGCSDVLSDSWSSNTDEPGEVSVENRTSSKAEIAVRVIDSDDETLFSRIFTLRSEKMTSHGTIETTPSRVHAFTANGASRTWRYAPDLPADFDCEPKDIGLTLHQDNTIEPWYDC